jgi:hypothetical protein
VENAGGYLRSPFTAAGNLWISSDTGTVPVFNILSSNCSCSISANSSSSSDSSIVSPSGVFVIAFAISSPSACCSLRSSLCVRQYSVCNPISKSKSKDNTLGEKPRGVKNVHGLIHNIDIQLPMNLLHGLPSLLHRRQRLTIDIRRLDRVDLLLQRRDLR